jgi:RNA polymerase sigma-70 factor (ECF subfamily)
MKKNDMRQQIAQLGNGAHALAIQLLGNTDDAADAVHDVFVKVLGKPASYNAVNGPFAPWFLRVVRNHCIDMMRRRRPGSADVGKLADHRPGPEASLEISQRDRGLQLALAKLTADQRQIIVLRDYMDLSYADIADVLEVAPGTVMSRLHRARMALKEELIQHV